MKRLIPLIFGGSILVVAACGGGNVSSSSPPSPTPLACTSGGPASSAWPAAESRSPGGPPPITSASVSSDTFTLTFDQGTPAFEVTPQSSARFTADPQGGPVDLSGSAGVLIGLRGFRGDMANYTGQKDFKTQGSSLVEVREIGDFEGVVGWAVGLAAPGCATVTSTGSTLTFKFRPGS